MIRWPIYRKRVRIAWALIDEADVQVIEPHLWRLHNAGYPWIHTDAKARQGTSMHRLLCGLAPDDPRVVDHINGDPLDNRRANLRVCTPAENGQNHPSRPGTSRFRGVSWNARLKKWVAQGKLNGKVHYLGIFDDELAAARVAAEWRKEHLPFTVESRAQVLRPRVDDTNERAA